jgi:hypothetical protein
MVLALLVVATPAVGRVADEPCPPGAIAVEAGASTQAADDPTCRRVEATVANVLIRNLTIEKYAGVAQKGAIQTEEAVGWA